MAKRAAIQNNQKNIIMTKLSIDQLAEKLSWIKSQQDLIVEDIQDEIEIKEALLKIKINKSWKN